MAMIIPSSGGDADEQVVSTINTTPLVDVMLVLLIIFLITIPVVNYSVPLNLPKERTEVRQSTPKDIVISVDQQGHIYWLDRPVKDHRKLIEELKAVARLDPQPEVHIRGDVASEYVPVGQIVYACHVAGIQKIGFITEPAANL